MLDFLKDRLVISGLNDTSYDELIAYTNRRNKKRKIYYVEIHEIENDKIVTIHSDPYNLYKVLTDCVGQFQCL